MRPVAVEFAVTEKLTTPPLIVSTLSQFWSLLGAKGGSRFAVAGSTTGNASEPAV